MPRLKNVTVLALVALLALATAACSLSSADYSSTHSAGPGEAETALVELLMGAGQLELAGGAEALADAQFEYDNQDWEPRFTYDGSSERGHLIVEQPQAVNVSLVGDYHYFWDIALNEEIPLDLVVDLGAGESDLDLSRLTVTSVDVDAGVGATRINLTGARDRDVTVNLSGGVGEITVELPSDVGVVADVEGGLTRINAIGLTQNGDQYTNDAYGRSEHTITLDVEAGVGEITLNVVE
jgi:hypothetical protein